MTSTASPNLPTVEPVQDGLYPVLPLRDIVVFPHMIVPLFVGREKSVRALEDVMQQDKQILLVAQRNAAEDDPTEDGIYRVGTVGTVLQLLKLPDGTVKVLVEGGRRAVERHRERLRDFDFVVARRPVEITALRLHAVQLLRVDPDVVKQGVARHAKIGFGVIGMHGPLVSEEDVELGPGNLVSVGRLCEQAVEAAGSRAPGERNAETPAGCHGLAGHVGEYVGGSGIKRL